MYRKEHQMTTLLTRIRRAAGDLVAEDRPGFKSIDASPARPDDGSWMRPLA